MYDIIQGIIDHTWQSNYTGDQQYIYYICGTVIVVLVVVFIDLIRDVFKNFFRS